MLQLIGIMVGIYIVARGIEVGFDANASATGRVAMLLSGAAAAILTFLLFVAGAAMNVPGAFR